MRFQKYYDNKRRLPFKINKRLLFAEWQTSQASKDLSNLVLLLEPLIDYWYGLLTIQSLKRDSLDWASLVSILETYEEDVDDLLSTLESYTNSWQDLKSELRYTLWQTLHYMSKKQLVHLNTGSRVIDFVNRYYKYRIINLLLNTKNLTKETLIDLEEVDTKEYPDFMMIDNFKLTGFERYLVLMKFLGVNSNAISKYCKLDRERFYYTEKFLWLQLKQTYLKDH
jgi:hypothetical protein